MKALSTFSTDESFDIYLSSTVPKRMRYQLLSSTPRDCARIGVYYSNPNRLELYVNGELRLPNNGFIDAKGRFRLKIKDRSHQLPDFSKKNSGENVLR